MRVSTWLELALAALAVIAGAAVIIPIWLGNHIAPQSVGVDLLIFFGMLALVAVGALLDVFAGTRDGHVTGLTLLSLGALALAVWFVLSFILFFFPPFALALAAALLGWGRLASSGAAQTPPK